MNLRRSDRRKTALRSGQGTDHDAAKGHAVVCAWCKRLKRPDGSWATLAPGVKATLPGELISHGICEDCLRSHKKPPPRGTGKKGT